MRELEIMAIAKLETDWDHTANLLAMQNNCHSSKPSQLKTPKQFHPFLRRQTSNTQRIDGNPKQSMKVLLNYLFPSNESPS
jgi:hypothetical protein